jgi:hypothetical protein
MLVDIVQLPNRTCGTSEIFSTKLVPPDNVDHLVGRDIPLQPFRSGNIKKYKLVENNCGDISETIVLSYEPIDIDVYNQEGVFVYPLQTKKLMRYKNRVMFGVNKHISGISKFITENVMNTDNPFYNKTDFAKPRSRYNTNGDLVTDDPPSEYYIICPDCFDDAYQHYRLYTNFDSRLLTEDEHLLNSKIMGKIQLPGRGEFMLGQSELGTPDEYLYDNNPINGNLDLYKLIELLNCAYRTDETILISKNPFDVYNIKDSEKPNFDPSEIERDGIFVNIYGEDDTFGMFDFCGEYDTYAPLIEEWEEYVEECIHDVCATAFKDIPWTKIEIRKLWSEEIFFDFYEGENITHVIYVDLIPFILGTIRLY